MKISKSKQELARIISENGGWRGGEFAAQDSNKNIHGARVCFYNGKPCVNGDEWRDGEYGLACDADDCIGGLNAIKNWHQTILSREEYFHLYPAPDARPEFCESVMRSIPEPSSKPTIEQLAADYRNLLDFARRKQEEADDAKADADEALRKLELAGEEIGIAVTPIAAKQGSDLVITDWRDLQVGDVVKITSVFEPGNEDYCDVIGTDAVVIYVGDPVRQDLVVSHDDMKLHIDGFRFIRRP